MGRDFSQVKPGKSSNTGRAPTDPPDGGGSRRVLWMIGAAVVLAVLIVIVAVSCGGGGDKGGAESEAIKTAHGPSALVDGVPRGYTHDKAGARTAAVNFMQAVNEAAGGRLTGDALREHAVSADPSPALQSVLDVSSGRQEHENETYNSVPLIATVTNFTPNEATVSVWAEGVAQTPTGGEGSPLGVSTSYSTTTVSVAWEDGDWQATDWKFESGPTPDKARFPADGPLSELGGQGFYSFYRD